MYLLILPAPGLFLAGNWQTFGRLLAGGYCRFMRIYARVPLIIGETEGCFLLQMDGSIVSGRRVNRFQLTGQSEAVGLSIPGGRRRVSRQRFSRSRLGASFQVFSCFRRSKILDRRFPAADLSLLRCCLTNYHRKTLQW